MKKENKTYCRVPFDSVTVSPTGRMQLCCVAQWTGGTEKTKLTDVNSIQEWFDGEYLRDVRSKMLKGNTVPECEMCYNNEKAHGESARTRVNRHYFDRHSDIIEHSIKKIDLKLGNKCNLKCKMCFPYASSELWKEWKELGWNDTTRDPNNDTSWKYYDGYFKEDYSWPKQKANMDKIKAAAEAAELLHITGGEPTINPEFFDLLGHLIKSGKSKEITLDVTTNATKIHPRFFEVAKQFKELWLTISMDGVGKTYEYVRYPANFETVYGNILRYQKFVKELGGNSRLVFNFVLQLWNLHNAIETVKTLSPLAVNDSRAPIRIEELTDPTFMHWSMLPEEHIKKVVKQIRTENTRLGHKIEWGVIALSRIMKTYKDHDRKNSVLLTQRLKTFTAKQDRHRGIDLKNYIPTLSELLE